MARFGDSGGHIGEAAQKVTKDLRDLGGQVGEAAKEQYDRASGQARQYYDQGREVAREWENELERFVHEKPLATVLIAAGVGLLTGLLWRRH